MKHVVANWKANKNRTEVEEWLTTFKTKLPELKIDNLKIIIAAPFIHLPQLKKEIAGIPNVSLASQTISQFPDGSYTGEVSARMAADYVNYSLLGHSERRKNLSETLTITQDQISLCQQNDIIPIIFFTKIEEIPKTFPKDSIFCLEPPSAISVAGKYQPAPVKEVIKNIADLKKTFPNQKFLYGGSVNPQNVVDYLKYPEIDGVAVGNASLDVNTFLEVIRSLSVI